jgi:hypothetical protein
MLENPIIQLKPRPFFTVSLLKFSQPEPLYLNNYLNAPDSTLLYIFIGSLRFE